MDRTDTRSASRDVPAPPVGPMEEVAYSRAKDHPRHDGTPQHAHEDRWAWRRKIKADPTTRMIYRFAVGLVGVALMLVAVLTGWLPGPGGIPLFLIGLAVLASEFEWAHRLLHWAKDKFRDLKHWSDRQPLWVRWTSGLGTLLLIGLAAWGSLVVLDVPSWVPGIATDLLTQLPGVEPKG